MNKVTPIFLISQPRSGSTMLQAVLSNHSAIATRSEPWVQLLLAPFTSPDIVQAPFNWKYAIDALDREGSSDEFLSEIQKQLKAIADGLYEREASATGATFFLDKTPRYYHISEQLFELYPDAKFLVLTRHPAAVVASIHKTWLSKKHFESIYDFSNDLIDAPRMMKNFVDCHQDSERVMKIDYETLIRDPKASFADIFRWIGLAYSENLLNYSANTSYQGKYGDPIGVGAGKVEARTESPKKIYAKVFDDRRLANMALGLTDYYIHSGYDLPGADGWENPKKTREFDRFIREHRRRSSTSISSRACLWVIIDRLMVRAGL